MVLLLNIMACFSFVFRLASGCAREVKNVMGIDGHPHNIFSLEKCKLACASDRKCVAFEFWPKLATCRTFENYRTTRASWKNDVKHYYKLDPTCLSGKYACFLFTVYYYVFELWISQFDISVTLYRSTWLNNQRLVNEPDPILTIFP